MKTGLYALFKVNMDADTPKGFVREALFARSKTLLPTRVIACRYTARPSRFLVDLGAERSPPQPIIRHWHHNARIDRLAWMLLVASTRPSRCLGGPKSDEHERNLVNDLYDSRRKNEWMQGLLKGVIDANDLFGWSPEDRTLTVLPEPLIVEFVDGENRPLTDAKELLSTMVRLELANVPSPGRSPEMVQAVSVSAPALQKPVPPPSIEIEYDPTDPTGKQCVYRHLAEDGTSSIYLRLRVTNDTPYRHRDMHVRMQSLEHSSDGKSWEPWAHEPHPINWAFAHGAAWTLDPGETAYADVLAVASDKDKFDFMIARHPPVPHWLKDTHRTGWYRFVLSLRPEHVPAVSKTYIFHWKGSFDRFEPGDLHETLNT